VTPAGGIVIDSGEAETVPFIRANVEKLGFRMADVAILLTGHAPHVVRTFRSARHGRPEGLHYSDFHADIKRMTGAKVMVMDADREALQSGIDRSALGGPGWKGVAVDRVLKDGDTVTLAARRSRPT
jgi:metallo-beta-lactamase class B